MIGTISSGAGILVPVINTGMGSVVAPLLGMSAEQRTPIISHEQTPIQASGNTTDGSSSETGTRSTTVQVMAGFYNEETIDFFSHDHDKRDHVRSNPRTTSN